MKNLKLSWRILLSCAIICTYQAKANLYFGLATSFSSDSYSANSEDLGEAKNLQKLYEVANLNTIQYDGTFAQMIQNIKYKIPKILSSSTINQGYFNNTLFSNFESNAFQGCIGSDGYLSSNKTILLGGGNNCKDGGEYKKIESINAFYEDIGSALLYNIQMNDPLFGNYLQDGTKNELSVAIGREVIKSIILSQNPGKNVSNMSMTQINEWFKGNGFDQDKNITTGIFKINGNEGKLTINAASFDSDILGIAQKQWNAVVNGIQNAFNQNQNLITANSILKSNASSSNYGFLASIGYLKSLNKVFYGGELGFDFGKYSIGKNQDLELNVTYNLGISLLGRAGYYMFNNSLAYITLGASFRDYKVSGFGTSTNQMIPHYVIGVGTEVFAYKDINMFLEFNHIIGLTKLDTGIRGTEKLALKSNKLSVGFRYYLDENTLTAKK